MLRMFAASRCVHRQMDRSWFDQVCILAVIEYSQLLAGRAEELTRVCRIDLVRLETDAEDRMLFRSGAVFDDSKPRSGDSRVRPYTKVCYPVCPEVSAQDSNRGYV